MDILMRSDLYVSLIYGDMWNGYAHRKKGRSGKEITPSLTAHAESYP